MVFEFLSNLDTTTTFLLLIIFILFVLAMKKILGIIKNAIIIAVAAVLFPIVMNRFFGYDIPMDPDSIISFMLLGLGIYFAYLVGKSVYKMLSLAEKAAKRVKPEKKPKEKGDKEDRKGNEEKLARKEEKSAKKEEKAKRKELEEREKELAKREKEVAWKTTLEESKKPKSNWTEDYAEIKEPASREKERPSRQRGQRKSSPVTPLPVIERKKKKKRKKNANQI